MEFVEFAVEIIETLARTIIVKANSYSEAERMVKNAYHKGDIQLTADNSMFDVQFGDLTEEYIKCFGKEDFENIENIDKSPAIGRI